MRVIFLDVDGVLNYVYCKARSPRGLLGIAKEPLSVLKEIVEQTNARIVLTSTWKRGWSRDPEECSIDGAYLDRKLRRAGMRILDKTDDNMHDRGTGIRIWLSSHPEVTNWIVLDNDVFDDYDYCGIMPHLVQTNFYDAGLKRSMISKCVAMLLQEEAEDGNQD